MPQAIVLIILICFFVKALRNPRKKQAAKTQPNPSPRETAPQKQHTPTAVKPVSQTYHAHPTVHPAQVKVHEHLAAECPLDAELQGSMAYDSPEGKDQCHEEMLFPADQPRPQESQRKPETQGNGVKLDFSPNAMVQAMVMQEILTRPCERRKR